MKLKYFLTFLFLSLYTLSYAQESMVKLNIKGGNNAVLGYFGALSVEAQHSLKKSFSVKGGVQCNTSGKFVAEARPAYFYDFAKGRLHAEALLHYAPSSGIHNLAFGAGVGFTARYVNMILGYYYRTITAGKESIVEPFNLYYELGVNCLASIPSWDLVLSISNNRIFELERHYQPSFSIDGWWYPRKKMGVTLGVSCKPAGIFNISSNYYQLYTNIGICYKW